VAFPLGFQDLVTASFRAQCGQGARQGGPGREIMRVRGLRAWPGPAVIRFRPGAAARDALLGPGCRTSAWPGLRCRPPASCARGPALRPSLAYRNIRLAAASMAGHLVPVPCSQGRRWQMALAAGAPDSPAYAYPAAICRSPAGGPGSFRLALLNDASLSSSEPGGPGRAGEGAGKAGKEATRRRADLRAEVAEGGHDLLKSFPKLPHTSIHQDAPAGWPPLAGGFRLFRVRTLSASPPSLVISSTRRRGFPPAGRTSVSRSRRRRR
jgi:hypothetical protein